MFYLFAMPARVKEPFWWKQYVGGRVEMYWRQIERMLHYTNIGMGSTPGQICMFIFAVRLASHYEIILT